MVDVDVSKKLIQMVTKFPELDKISLHRAFEVDGSAILILGSMDVLLLRRERGMTKNLEQVLNKKIWLLEDDSSDRKVLEDLFFPVKILTVNQVWLPDGSIITKAIISGRKTERFPIDIDQVKRVIKIAKDMDLIVEFEKS